MRCRPTLMVESERGFVPLLVGFLYEIQPLGRRNKRRGQRAVLDGGRQAVGGFEPTVSERTQRCHCCIGEKSVWIEPEDLVLVPGQLEFIRVGDWIDVVYVVEQEGRRSIMCQCAQIWSFGSDGAFVGCVGMARVDNIVFQFLLHDSMWTADVAELASRHRAHGVALLHTIRYYAPTDDGKRARPYKPPPLILRDGKTIIAVR